MYKARWAQPEEFDSIQLHSKMMYHHNPYTVDEALQQILQQERYTPQLGPNSVVQHQPGRYAQPYDYDTTTLDGRMRSGSSDSGIEDGMVKQQQGVVDIHGEALGRVNPAFEVNIPGSGHVNDSKQADDVNIPMDSLNAPINKFRSSIHMHLQPSREADQSTDEIVQTSHDTCLSDMDFDTRPSGVITPVTSTETQTPFTDTQSSVLSVTNNELPSVLVVDPVPYVIITLREFQVPRSTHLFRTLVFPNNDQPTHSVQMDQQDTQPTDIHVCGSVDSPSCANYGATPTSTVIRVLEDCDEDAEVYTMRDINSGVDTRDDSRDEYGAISDSGHHHITNDTDLTHPDTETAKPRDELLRSPSFPDELAEMDPIRCIESSTEPMHISSRAVVPSPCKEVAYDGDGEDECDSRHSARDTSVDSDIYSTEIPQDSTDRREASVDASPHRTIRPTLRRMSPTQQQSEEGSIEEVVDSTIPNVSLDQRLALAGDDPNPANEPMISSGNSSDHDVESISDYPSDRLETSQAIDGMTQQSQSGVADVESDTSTDSMQSQCDPKHGVCSADKHGTHHLPHSEHLTTAAQDHTAGEAIQSDQDTLSRDTHDSEQSPRDGETTRGVFTPNLVASGESEDDLVYFTI